MKSFKDLYCFMEANRSRMEKIDIDKNGIFSIHIYQYNFNKEGQSPTVNFEVESKAIFQIRFCNNNTVEIYDTSKGHTPKDPVMQVAVTDNISNEMSQLGKIPLNFYTYLNDKL